MGWLWSSGNSSNAKDQLDPSLRDFLDHEAPSGQRPALPSKPVPKPTEPAKQQASEPVLAPVVPPQSQFQDGRYAHLWKNYTPQDILENRSKTEQDKMKDIVEAFEDRKKQIGNVAMENCAFEYMEQYNCFRNPSFKEAATLCRKQTKKFNRCYEIQAKFLKALGYLALDGTDPVAEERIQMRADELYQHLKAQEAAVEKAQAEGLPLPTFENVLSKQNVVLAAAGKPLTQSPPAGISAEQQANDEVWAHLKPDARAEYEKQLAKLPPEEREIERQSILGELRASTGMFQQVGAAYEEERIQRLKRKDAGQSTLGDAVKRWWGWDDR